MYLQGRFFSCIGQFLVPPLLLVGFNDILPYDVIVSSWQNSVNNLKNLSFDVSGDKVVMVVGPVGSGKVRILNVTS